MTNEDTNVAQPILESVDQLVSEISKARDITPEQARTIVDVEVKWLMRCHDRGDLRMDDVERVSRYLNRLAKPVGAR